MDDPADRCHLSGGIFPGELLPQCVSSAVHLCYMTRTMVTAMQQDENIPAGSNPEGSPVLSPSSSPVHPPRTQPLPVPPLLDIPFVGTPLVGCPFAEFIVISTQKSETALPAVHSTIIRTRGPMLTPKRSKLVVNIALHRAMRTQLN